MGMDAAAMPADSLEGCTLSSGWLIQERIGKAVGGTGSNFGICYRATKDGATAFVKAVDFRRALVEADPIQSMARLGTELSWEKEVLELCRAHKLSKVIGLVGHEYFIKPESEGDLSKRISCLVMEIGAGDLRGELSANQDRPFSWVLFVMRDICLAVDQLHRKGVAHLDVKPSNVIAMETSPDSFKGMKLGDLGRVVRKGVAGPFDELAWPGDRSYSPPEKWYGYRTAQWNNERESADIYLLGSLLVFLITQASFTTILYNEIPDNYKPGIYRGDFDKNLIDILVYHQVKALDLHLAPYIPSEIRDELVDLIIQMTHPDPSLRGDRGARKGGVVGVDRFHQKFLRMAKRVELKEKGLRK